MFFSAVKTDKQEEGELDMSGQVQFASERLSLHDSLMDPEIVLKMKS